MAAVKQSDDGKKAMADEDVPDTDEATEEREETRAVESRPPKGSVPQQRPRAVAAGGGGAGFFTIYKKGHGYWTRMGTAIGAGLLGLVIALELYNQIPVFLSGTPSQNKKVALVASLVFLVAYSAWAFWFTNKPSTVEFLIATDSEMKKVNWTTRKELIGSTKVVIIFMFLIAFLLFAFDIFFGYLFYFLRVLNDKPF